MRLLTAKDYDALRDAMYRYRKISIERGGGGRKVAAKTTCLTARGVNIWGQSMVVTLIIDRGHTISCQHFRSVEELRDYEPDI